MSDGLFEGLRILDFSQVIAGPFATMQMALQGADVIKIERPGEGDMMRALMANPPYRDHGTSAGFLAFNSGKRSLTLDLKAAPASEILAPLIDRADVVVESFRPGVMAALGLDAETLMRRRPALVYCSISGYGQHGPKAHQPAYDGAIQAESGMMSVTGWPDGDALRAGFFAVDIPTGYAAAFAMSGALWRAQRSGKGTHIDLAMMDTALSQMAMQVNEYFQSGVTPARLGNMSAARLASDTTYRTADGALAVVALTPAQIAALHGVLGLDEGAGVEEMAAVFESAGSMFWAGSVVRDLKAALADAQLEGRAVLAHPPAPTGLERAIADGGLTMTGAPFVTTPAGPPPGPAPALGQHTEEILLSCGFELERIAVWRRQGVV